RPAHVRDLSSFPTRRSSDLVLIAILAVVLAGKGVAALQEAGWVPASLVAFPRIELLGVHPTLQGLLVQAAVLVVLVAGFWWSGRSEEHTSELQSRENLVCRL